MKIESGALKEAGLTNGEIKVYLALLELGPSTTGPIIEKSSIAKSIVYQILDKLVKKGLVSYITKEHTKYYQATDPSRLVDYVEEREKILQDNKQKINDLLPTLILLQKSAKKNDVKIFEGFKGMTTVHECTYQKLTKGEEYFFLGIPPEQPKYFHAYWEKDHKRRIKSGIKCKLLFHPSTSKEILKNRNSYSGCDARYMSLSINTPAWFMGYKDVAVIGFASENPITIEITNQEIADSFKAYFQEFWRKSKRFEKYNAK